MQNTYRILAGISEGQGNFEDRGLIGGQQVLEMDHEEVRCEGTH
jgi:hypothetical protein